MKLIDGDKLKEMLHTAAIPMTEYGRGVQTGYQYARAFIDNMPAIDAESVRTEGNWLGSGNPRDYPFFFCSRCRSNGDTSWKYFPHCGAKMDGGAKNGFD